MNCKPWEVIYPIRKKDHPRTSPAHSQSLKLNTRLAAKFDIAQELFGHARDVVHYPQTTTPKEQWSRNYNPLYDRNSTLMADFVARQTPPCGFMLKVWTCLNTRKRATPD